MKISPEKLASLSKEKKIELLEALKEKKRRNKRKKPAYKPHEGQLEIHTCPVRNRFTFAGNGCWAPGTKFRLMDGRTKAVEDIEIGDKLVGPDGTARTVLQLFSGEEPMYRIESRYHDPIEVNESHILTLQRWKRDSSIGKGKVNVVEEITVKEYMEKKEYWKRNSYQYRPAEGVDYPVKSVPISPYVLGLWLGDGTSDKLSITTMDQITVDKFREEWPDYQVRITGREDNKASTYHLSNRGANKGLDALRELKVYKNKHIPQKYKFNSKEARYQLLAGLIDTDGHLDRGNQYEIIQKREVLRDDIAEVANSLGFRTNKTTKMINGVAYYRLVIAGHVDKIPVNLPHKKACPKELEKRQRSYDKCPFTIEPIGRGKFYGFMVDKDNLVLTHDYVTQRNSGKSTLLIHEVVAAAKGYNPWLKEHTYVPAKIVVVLDRPDKVEEVFLREINKWYDTSDWQFDKNGKPYINKLTLPNGSTVNIMFKEADPLAFEGIEADYVFIDEPVKRKIWVALQRAGRTKGRKARYMYIGTPIAAPWLRTDIYEPWSRGELTDVECFRFGTHLNEDNLQEGFLETFANQLTDKERKVRLEGAFFDSDGLALADVFDRSSHIISREQFENIWEQNNPCVLAIDPHTSKPHHACLVGIDRDGNYFYIKELRLKEVARQFASSLREFIEGYRVVDIICDSSGQADGTGGEGYKSFIQILKDEGLQVRATTFKDKSDEDFIDRIKTVLAIPLVPNNFGLRVPKLRIVEGNKGIVTDIENVGWQKHRDIDANKPKLEIRERDFLAAFKYALASGLNVKSGSQRAKRYGKSKKSNAYGMGKRRRFKV